MIPAVCLSPIPTPFTLRLLRVIVVGSLFICMSIYLSVFLACLSCPAFCPPLSLVTWLNKSCPPLYFSSIYIFILFLLIPFPLTLLTFISLSLLNIVRHCLTYICITRRLCFVMICKRRRVCLSAGKAGRCCRVVLSDNKCSSLVNTVESSPLFC